MVIRLRSSCLGVMMKKTINNTTFYLRLLWQKNKSYFFAFFLLVFAAAFSPMIAAVLPKVMLHDLLTNNPQQFFIDFGVLAFLSCLCALISAYFRRQHLVQRTGFSDIFLSGGLVSAVAFTCVCTQYCRKPYYAKSRKKI